MKLVLAVLYLLINFSYAEAPNIILILTDDQGWSQVNEQAHPDLPESKSEYR